MVQLCGQTYICCSGYHYSGSQINEVYRNPVVSSFPGKKSYLTFFKKAIFPFVTAWMGENHFAALPVALYGVVLLLAAIAYFTLTRTLVFHHGQDSTLANALGRNFKGKLSVLIYAVTIPLAFAIPWLACALYVRVAVLWLIPDRRIEKALNS